MLLRCRFQNQHLEVWDRKLPHHKCNSPTATKLHHNCNHTYLGRGLWNSSALVSGATMEPGSLSLASSACLPPSSSTPAGEGAGAAGAPLRGATSRATSSRCCSSSMSLDSSSSMQQHQQQEVQQHLRLLPATACSLPRHLRLLTKATIGGGRSGGRHLLGPPPPPLLLLLNIPPCMVSLLRRRSILGA